MQGSESFVWPDAAVPAIVALENASHDVLGDFQKYNQKLRQLVFNLKVVSAFFIMKSAYLFTPPHILANALLNFMTREIVLEIYKYVFLKL